MHAQLALAGYAAVMAGVVHAYGNSSSYSTTAFKGSPTALFKHQPLNFTGYYHANASSLSHNTSSLWHNTSSLSTVYTTLVSTISRSVIKILDRESPAVGTAPETVGGPTSLPDALSVEPSACRVSYITVYVTGSAPNPPAATSSQDEGPYFYNVDNGTTSWQDGKSPSRTDYASTTTVLTPSTLIVYETVIGTSTTSTTEFLTTGTDTTPPASPEPGTTATVHVTTTSGRTITSTVPHSSSVSTETPSITWGSTPGSTGPTSDDGTFTVSSTRTHTVTMVPDSDVGWNSSTATSTAAYQSSSGAQGIPSSFSSTSSGPINSTSLIETYRSTPGISSSQALNSSTTVPGAVNATHSAPSYSSDSGTSSISVSVSSFTILGTVNTTTFTTSYHSKSGTSSFPTLTPSGFDGIHYTGLPSLPGTGIPIVPPSDSHSTTAAVTSTTSAPLPSYSSTNCGESGNFTLNWDDEPQYVPSDNSTEVVWPPVFNPYHHLFFANGYAYAKPPSAPFAPASSPNLAVFMPNITDTSSPSAGGAHVGEIGAGPRAADSVWWFDAYSSEMGCDNGSSGPCKMVISGYTYDAKTGLEVKIHEQTAFIPPCATIYDCKLDHIELDRGFRRLSGIQFEAFVDDTLRRIFVMDNLSLGWSNNSCEAGLLRLRQRK